MLISLAGMKSEQKGRVALINGGRALLARLYAMGVCPGVSVTRKNAQLMRGPLVIEVAGSKLAIGFGMAMKIMVEVTE